MQNHRVISGLTILVMIVLVAAGWFLVAQPQLAAADTANKSVVDAQSQIASRQATLVSLKNDQKKLPALKKQVQALQLSIPANIDSSAYIRGLNDLAANAGVLITAITVNDPQAYAPPVSAAPATPAAATPSPSPSASASAAPTAPVATGWVPTTDALITSSNFVAIPVTITVDGQWDGALAFIKGLQSGTRLFLVTGFTTKQANSTSGAAVSGGVEANISGFIYALIDPKTAAAQAAADKAASASPTPTPTPTVSSSPNPSGSSTPTPTTSPTPTK